MPTIIFGCFYLLGDIIGLYTKTDDPDQFTKLRNSLFILAALISAPFLVWRTMIASKQAETAQEQAAIAQEKSYTELFTQAIEQLGSVKPIGKDQYEENIEVRVGALYALERIMHDSDKDAKTIIDTLCTYVKHNCGKPRLFKNEISKEELEILSEDKIKTKREKFIETLKEDPPADRYDIQTALTIIGRRPGKYKTKETMPDLSNVNLQGADLVNFDLSHCKLNNAHIDGANLQEANLQRADLRGANLEEANLQWVNLEEANLQEAELQGANLQEANLQDVQITYAHKTAASVIWVDFTKAKYDFDILQEQVKDMFGHKTLTILPEDMKAPDYWSVADVKTIEEQEKFSDEWEAFKIEKGFG